MIVYGGSGLLCNVWAETEEQKGYWRKKVIELHKKTLNSGKLCPELIIIDAQQKKAASTYDKDQFCFEDDFEVDQSDSVDFPDFD